ncbi:hypothetical protein AMK59_3359, partial [Oryctes borbonicus]
AFERTVYMVFELCNGNANPGCPNLYFLNCSTEELVPQTSQRTAGDYNKVIQQHTQVVPVDLGESQCDKTTIEHRCLLSIPSSRNIETYQPVEIRSATRESQSRNEGTFVDSTPTTKHSIQHQDPPPVRSLQKVKTQPVKITTKKEETKIDPTLITKHSIRNQTPSPTPPLPRVKTATTKENQSPYEDTKVDSTPTTRCSIQNQNHPPIPPSPKVKITTKESQSRCESATGTISKVIIIKPTVRGLNQRQTLMPQQTVANINCIDQTFSSSTEVNRNQQLFTITPVVQNQSHITVIRATVKPSIPNPLKEVERLLPGNASFVTNNIKTYLNEYYWDDINYVDRQVHFIPLNSYDPEYEYIDQLFRQTNKKCFKVTHIDRIQNPYLLAAFLLKKDEITKRIGNVGIEELFHGTKAACVPNICNDNFDWRRHGENKGNKFGQGVSFTPISNYATHYADDVMDGRIMLLAYVLIGDEVIGTKDTRLPPRGKDTSIKQDRHVIVKYEDNEFYPAYKITYKCTSAGELEQRRMNRRGYKTRQCQQGNSQAFSGYYSYDNCYDDYYGYLF